jgi:cytoskeletal protein RodZ
MEVGRELAQARQQLGLSLQEISNRTKISVERLSAIERGSLAELPPPVYLNGFLRAYAAEVNLDGADVTERYLAELQRVSAAPEHAANHASDLDDEFESEYPPVATPTTHDAPTAAFASERPGPVEVSPEPELIAAPPPDPPELELHHIRHAEPDVQLEQTAQYDSIDEPEPEFDSAPHSSRLFSVEPIEESALSRAAAETREPRYGILAVVMIAAVVAGVLLSANLNAIKRALAMEPEIATQPASQESPPVNPKPETPEQRAATDARHSTEGAVEAKPSDTSKASYTTPPSVPEATPGEPDAKRTGGEDPGRPIAPEPAAPTRGSNEATANGTSNGITGDTTTPNLSGAWTLTNRVESSGYQPFNNLNLGYHLQWQQRGNRITGTGTKWMENGKALPERQRTPIMFQGTRNGRQIELEFTETGSRRVSEGTFTLELADDGTLKGTFRSDVANSQGSSLAVRVDSEPHNRSRTAPGGASTVKRSQKASPSAKPSRPR